ncbi:MAG: acyl-CoA desaturase [Bacteroidia bacterium]|nr:acyl-CoA desaturase [Bacteroidia bacterium]
MYKASFNNRKSPFYTTLRAEVDKYFAENHIKPTGNWNLYLKTSLFLSLAVYLYIQLVFFTPVWWIAIPLCILFGFNSAFIGFNIMHDGCHGSYSDKKWVNDLMGLSLNLLGSDATLWKAKHNVVHHTFTNIDGLDADITQSSLLRFAPSQPLLKIHRFQHIYAVFLYGLITFAWIFEADFTKYFSKKILNSPIRDLSPREHFTFWASKVMYLLVYILIPAYVLGFVPFLIGFMVMNITLGVVIALVFQLAHVVEITEFEDATHDNIKIEDEWAIHQIKTTANFATRNPVISWFLGGLNFQVEHHLFPKISHVHYPHIQKIVADVCDKFQVEYKSYPTMRQALVSHFRLLRQLGTGMRMA